MREVLLIAKALADENRLRAVMFLRQGEMCVCQIVEMLGLAPSTVSKHLDVLHRAGLAESRKEGLWVFYRLPDRPTACARKALGWLDATLCDDARTADDTRRRKAVMKMDKDKLCCRYRS